MKEKFYYYRDELIREPLVTVCILEDEDGEVAKGIAICSFKDMPNKKIGRAIAKGRALHSFENGTFGEIRREEAADVLNFVNYPQTSTFKGEFDPILSEFEEKLLEKR